MIFIDWNILRVAIDGARGGEHHVFAPMLCHRFAKFNCSCNIVIVVTQRIFYRFVHILSSSEMNDSVKLILREYFVHLVKASQVSLDKRHVGSFVPCELCHAINGQLKRIVQIINNCNFVPMLEQGEGGVTADEPCLLHPCLRREIGYVKPQVGHS